MSREPEVDFILPGRWWRVPLDTDEGMRGSARALARETLGRDDDLAAARGQLVGYVAEAADAARRADAQDFYFALEMSPGQRVPMSMGVFWPLLPALPTLSAHPVAASASLADALKGGPGDVEVLDLDDDYGVVRVVEVHEPADEVADLSDLGRILASYWIVNPRSPRALLMSFNSGLVQFRDEVVFLCDAIAGSVTWRGGIAEPRTVTEPSEVSGSAAVSISGDPEQR